MITYLYPKRWISYDGAAIATALAEAKAVMLSLQTIHYQRRWVEELQRLELKREVAGTSKIEGADFTERELDEAMKRTPEELQERAQKQAAAAVRTYKWIATIPNDRPINGDLICIIHRNIVSGADDDHCAPGRIRRQNENVIFGLPRHRGCEGGDECEKAFDEFTKALQGPYQEHDLLVQAIAAHYHLASMHPFQDGNGRTARALEAVLLGRAGLRDSSFIAMSNYYYEEKPHYLAALAEVRQKDHDLTPFIIFALKGIASQAKRLLVEIQYHVSKAIFRDLAIELFGRLTSTRKRAIAERQLYLLNQLLNVPHMDYYEFWRLHSGRYSGLKSPAKAYMRDISNLYSLGAIAVEQVEGQDNKWIIRVRLEWPMEISESEFFQKLKDLPKAKTLAFLN